MNTNDQTTKPRYWLLAQQSPPPSTSVLELDKQRGLSVREFAKIVGIGRSRCYIEIALGHVRALKAGARTIIPATEVEAFFARLDPLLAKPKGER